MLSIAVIFIVPGAALLLRWPLVSRYHEETDNAYVQGNVVQITLQIAGTVIGIHVDDTGQVKLVHMMARWLTTWQPIGIYHRLYLRYSGYNKKHKKIQTTPSY